MSEMKIITRDFGEVSVERESVIRFPEGIYCFEEYKNYVLLSPLGEGENPMWLQSTDGEAPCFIVFEADKLLDGYSPALSDEAKALLEIEDGDEIHFLSIAVIGGDYKKTTVNLKSPLAVNASKSIAAQVILEDDYPLRFPIFNEKEGE